jgi:type 1 glutamine amidotransferase
VKFRPEAKPMAKVRVKDRDCVVAWAFDRPDSAGGRSYGNTLGHFHQNFGLEPLRKLMLDGILWTAHREIPAAGAPCAISEADMV